MSMVKSRRLKCVEFKVICIRGPGIAGHVPIHKFLKIKYRRKQENMMEKYS